MKIRWTALLILVGALVALHLAHASWWTKCVQLPVADVSSCTNCTGRCETYVYSTPCGGCQSAFLSSCNKTSFWAAKTTLVGQCRSLLGCQCLDLKEGGTILVQCECVP